MSIRAFREMPIDPRDQHPDDAGSISPPGGGYVMSMPMPLPIRGGVLQENIKALHDAITRQWPEAMLCGVLHHDEVEVWQLPHTARALMRRNVRQLQRQSGHQYTIIRCYQHPGECPDGAQ